MKLETLTLRKENGNLLLVREDNFLEHVETIRKAINEKVEHLEQKENNIGYSIDLK
jgi:hypothetical protein